MHPRHRVGSTFNFLTSIILSGIISLAVFAIFHIAPTETTMGPVQRVVYIHVSLAAFALAGFVLALGFGLVYLATRDLMWDHWLQAIAEVGWLCSGLTLITGSIWARQAWGTWWTWDPRLTSTFLLGVMYSSLLVVRSDLSDPHRRARISAVLAVIGAANVPMVIMATRWFRSIHPVSAGMEPLMRGTLLISVIAFCSLFALLVVRRRTQLGLESRIESLEFVPRNNRMSVN